MQLKEAALLYRLQIATFTRTVAGEAVRAWVVEEAMIKGWCRRWVARCTPHTWTIIGYELLFTAT